MRVLTAAAASLALALGIGATAQMTAAAWRDDAYVNAGPLGGENVFDIALVEEPVLDGVELAEGGVVRQAEGDGIAWAVPGAESLVPGQTLSTVIGVFNNSSSYRGDIVARVQRTGAADLDISDYLQITLVDLATGEVLIDGQFLSDAGSVEAPLALERRDAETALEEGETFTTAGIGSSRALELRLFYSETNAAGAADTASLNGGKAHLQMVFDAVSG